MIKRTLFFGNPAYLSMSSRQLVIRQPDVKSQDGNKDVSTRTIPIEDIGVVVIESPQVTITSGAMSALLENNTAIITCNEKRMPTGLLLPLDGNSIQNERFRDQLDASVPLRKQLWQQTVMAKIANQGAVLKEYTIAETGCMDAWSRGVRSGDSENLEARGAAYYWRNIFGDDCDFTRDREGKYPNNLLNYGYAILRGVIARALVGSGLLPTMGIHHHNRYNAYCLADDVMEPYRPYVDRLVLDIMQQHPADEALSKEMKTRLLSIPTLDVTIRGKRSPLMVAASLTTASLARCFTGEQRHIEYPEM